MRSSNSDFSLGASLSYGVGNPLCAKELWRHKGYANERGFFPEDQFGDFLRGKRLDIRIDQTDGIPKLPEIAGNVSEAKRKICPGRLPHGAVVIQVRSLDKEDI